MKLVIMYRNAPDTDVQPVRASESNEISVYITRTYITVSILAQKSFVIFITKQLFCTEQNGCVIALPPIIIVCFVRLD
jgi:hypothetical protein